MISLKLNLAALTHVLQQSKKDPEEMIICIPVKKNKLFKSDKGAVYLDIIGFDYDDTTPNKQYKDTHLLKQSFSKAEREAMTEEQLKALPILGNARVSGGSQSEGVSNAVTNEPLNPDDDLPF